MLTPVLLDKVVSLVRLAHARAADADQSFGACEWFSKDDAAAVLGTKGLTIHRHGPTMCMASSARPGAVLMVSEPESTDAETEERSPTRSGGRQGLAIADAHHAKHPRQVVTLILRSKNIGLPVPHRTMTTKNLYLAAMACALAGNAALAQSALPSDTQLEAWDKKFLPGQYRVEEYDVDASGKPLPNTARLKSEAQCISQKEMQAISRGPAMLAFTWKCEPAPEHTSLDDSLFQLALSCGGSKGKPVAGFAAVFISGDGQVVRSSYVKVEFDSKHPDQPRKLVGLGSQMTRTGDCSSAEARAKKTRHQLLADDWASSGKPMAHDVARCLRSIDGGDYAAAYATCRATLGLRGMAGTEAEVVLLEQLGLLTGYVHQGEQLGFYRKAVAAAERFHGSSSAALIDSLVNTALVVKAKEKAFGEAAALLGRAVALGVKSSDKAVQAKSVAHYRYWVQALAESGDKPAALAAARRAAEHAVLVLGPGHEDTGSAWTDLGLLERDAGQLEAARESFVKSLSVWEAAKIPAYVRGAKEKIAQVDALMKRGGR